MAPCICDTPNRCRAAGTCRREQLRQASQIKVGTPEQRKATNVIPFPGRKPNAPTPPRKA